MARFPASTAACVAVAALLAAGPAPAQDSPLTVGAVYVGSVNDYGYNRAMKDGLDHMRQNIPGLKLIEAENIPKRRPSRNGSWRG